MKKFYAVLLCVVAGIVFASSVHAEDFTFSYGAAERIREEIWDNLLDLGTNPHNTDERNSFRERNFFRFRTSVWGGVNYNENQDNSLGLYVRLTNEMKEYLGSDHYRLAENLDFLNRVTPESHFSHFEEDEIVFDNLYLDYKRILGSPVDIRIGRQELTYGEGFLVSEGTPGDGSRTFYFNAVKATVNLTPCNSIDLVYITDPKSDIYLPSVHGSVDASTQLYQNNKRILNTSNEQGAVLYSKNKIDDFNVEPYYIFKTEAGFTALTPLPNPTPRLNLNTFGARLLYDNSTLKAGAEFAHEFGKYQHGGIYPNGLDRTGNGGYIFAGYNFKNVPLKPYAELRYVYLSGDNKNSSENESWDPLFSRQPYWNELFIYTLVPQTFKYSNGVPGYWTNLNIYKATVKLNFTDNANLTLAYQYLASDQTTNLAGLTALATPSMYTNSGHDIGSLPTVLAYYKFNKNIDAFVQWEYLIPGNFYQSGAKDGNFFRWQLQFKI
jgi:predicted porin